MKTKNSKYFFIIFFILKSSIFYSQNFPIVGFGDPANYTIGYYTVEGSSGLDLHWYGGIRFGDRTSNSVMQITNGNVGIGTNNPITKLHINNGDNSYGAILANASESYFSLYTKTLSTNGVSESFRLGLKCFDNENNGFISFYRGGSQSGGFLGFSTNGQERIRISDTGNVGIGTAYPQWGLLQLNSVNDNATALRLDVGAFSMNGQGKFMIDAPSVGGGRFTISQSGNVGIGTPNPNTKLHVIGTQTIEDSTNPAIGFTGGTSNGTVGAFGDNIRMINFSANGTTTVQGNGNIDIKTEGGYNVIFGTAAIERMRILSNGNIGIGTAVPDEKLTVKGKIHTQEIRVDLLGPLVPDYVFAKDYKLKSLQEVEDYIKQNSHLPEIPSAKEIEKNGLMLAEMNMSLLKKIEELTLYSIEQNKKTETQAKKIEAQSKEIETLKDLVLRVAKIENDLAKKK